MESPKNVKRFIDRGAAMSASAMADIRHMLECLDYTSGEHLSGNTLTSLCEQGRMLARQLDKVEPTICQLLRTRIRQCGTFDVADLVGLDALSINELVEMWDNRPSGFVPMSPEAV